MTLISKIKASVLYKLYVKQWVIGLLYGDIREMIRTKSFNFKIKWLSVSSYYRFHGDPFLHKNSNGNLDILFEDFSLDENYGNISLMTLDQNLKITDQKILLDTKSHLSYPFIFRENNKIYVFPESARSGVLSCYEFDPEIKALSYLKEVINLPLLDSTILKHDNKYWLFGTLNDKENGYIMNVYFSDNLLGPYMPHTANPVKKGLNGTRGAGEFIAVDGIWYRPSQNCENAYGESITINKLLKLDDTEVIEEPYMLIMIDDENLDKHGIHTIHTINSMDGILPMT